MPKHPVCFQACVTFPRIPSPSSSPSCSLPHSLRQMKICIANSKHPKTSKSETGCLTGIFNRILCRDFSSPSAEPVVVAVPACAAAAHNLRVDNGSPSVVARLMGLESMPEFDWLPRTSDSIRRSRSVNSVLELLSSDWNHHGVRNSASFREIPTFLRQENDDFLILSFESDCITDPQTSRSDIRQQNSGKRRKDDTDRSRIKRKENRTCSRLGMKKEVKALDARASSKDNSESTYVGLASSSPIDHKFKEKRNKKLLTIHGENLKMIPRTGRIVVPDMTKMRKKKAADLVACEKPDLRVNSENSSPVSVLDRRSELETDLLLSEEDSSPNDSEARRHDLSSPAKFHRSSSHVRSISGSREIDPMNKAFSKIKQLNSPLPDALILHGEIRKLAEEDATAMNSGWRNGLSSANCEYLGIQLEHEIMNCLVLEFVSELFNFPPVYT